MACTLEGGGFVPGRQGAQGGLGSLQLRPHTVLPRVGVLNLLPPEVQASAGEHWGLTAQLLQKRGLLGWGQEAAAEARAGAEGWRGHRGAPGDSHGWQGQAQPASLASSAPPPRPPADEWRHLRAGKAGRQVRGEGPVWHLEGASWAPLR